MQDVADNYRRWSANVRLTGHVAAKKKSAIPAAPRERGVPFASFYWRQFSLDIRGSRRPESAEIWLCVRGDWAGQGSYFFPSLPVLQLWILRYHTCRKCHQSQEPVQVGVPGSRPSSTSTKPQRGARSEEHTSEL